MTANHSKLIIRKAHNLLKTDDDLRVRKIKIWKGRICRTLDVSKNHLEKTTQKYHNCLLWHKTFHCYQ